MILKRNSRKIIKRENIKIEELEAETILAMNYRVAETPRYLVCP